MSPLEVRPAREIERSLNRSKVKMVQPGRTERVSPAYFGLDDGFDGEKIHLEISCDENDVEGEVVLFRKRGKPRFQLGSMGLGFKVHDVQKTQYKLKKGAGIKYIRERGHKVLRIEMK